MKGTSLVAFHLYCLMANGTGGLRLTLDTAIFVNQLIYNTSVTMLFFVVNGAVCMQLNSIRQQVRQANLQENQLVALKESYFLCNEVVNEMSDAFGVVMLTGMLHDFMNIINEGTYTLIAYSTNNGWSSFVFSTLLVLFSLANSSFINFGGQHLTRQVVYSNLIIKNWRYMNFSLLQGRAVIEGPKQSIVFAARLGRKSQRFYQPRWTHEALHQRRRIFPSRKTTVIHCTFYSSVNWLRSCLVNNLKFLCFYFCSF